MRKRDIAEFAVLGAVALASLIFIIFRGNSKVHYRLPSQPEIVREEITKITASGDSGELELVKDGDSWKIVSLDRPMDPGKVDQLLNLIAESGAVDLISERSSGSDFGFTKENLLFLNVYQGENVVRNWTLGNLSESSGYTYFRIGGSGPVYSTRGDLRSILAADPSSLRDRTVLSFDRDAVTSIKFTGGGKTVNLVKEEGIDNSLWKDGTGKEYDVNQITNILYRYSALKCDAFVPDEIAGGETARLEFGGTENTFIVYDKREGKYLCGSSLTPDFFYMNEYLINNLLKTFNPPPVQ